MMDQLTTADIRNGASRIAPAAGPSCLAGPSLTEALLDPANVFRDPAEVVEHPWFAPEEKRAVLLSWARDELALQQIASRTLPEMRPASRIDRVIDALSHVDATAAGEFRAAVASLRGATPGRIFWMRPVATDRRKPTAPAMRAPRTGGGEPCRNASPA